MLKSRTLLFFLLHFICSNILNPVFSQYNSSISKITIASPNVASLGKYGDIPVGYHTGIPDINIPIYTIKTGVLELPINLSYHSSGLKVQEQASWVGAGWALNAGGVITRTVMGAPDDKGLHSANTDKGHFSDYGYNSYLFSVGPSSCDPNPNGNGPAYCPAGTTYAPQDSYIQAGKLDGEPDLYFFNFNGHAGKFYFNDDRTPVILPQQDLKITPIYTGTDWRGITGFIVTTPDGVKYYFGQNQISDGNPDALEITYNISTQSTYTGQGATSAWYLNRIVSADEKFCITLIYQSESYSYYSLSMFPIPAIPNPNLFSYNLEYDLDKNFIDGVRLSKIKYLHGEVNFNAGDLRQDLSLGTSYTGIDDLANSNTTLGGRTLDNITIQSTDVCKKYKLSTSYFYDGTPLTGSLFTQTYTALNLTSDKYRLRLDSIVELSCDNSLQIPPYKFNYFTESVPRKLSFGIDHWGFSNGASNTALIPTYTIVSGGTPTSFPGANRDAAWPQMRAGALQKIQYPTGGSTVFDYESNSIYNTNSNYVNNPLTALVVHQSGQSQITHTVSFTIVGSGDCTFSVNNSSTNWSPTFSIKNSNNLEQGTGPWLISVSSIFNNTLSLPPGTYQATLSFPSNSGPTLNLGATASINQWQNVTTQGGLLVGGLRIKTITNNSGISTTLPNITSYGYNFSNNVINGHSSGVLYSRPVYLQALRNDVWGVVSGLSCSSIGCFYCFGSDVAFYKSPSSIRPMASVNGNHIGYGEVYVSQNGNGYSVYKYYGSNGAIPQIWDAPAEDVCVRALNTFCDPNIPNSPAPPEPFDPMRGELAYKANYNQNKQLISSSSYFPLYQFDSLITPGIISKFFVTGYQATSGYLSAPQMYDQLTINIPNSLSPYGVNTFTEYFLKSAKKIRDSVETTLYDPATGNYLNDNNVTYYLSKYHCNPTQILTYSSIGEKLTTNLKSAFDYRITNNISDRLSTYYNNNIVDLNNLSTALAGVTIASTDNHYYWQRLNIFTNYRYQKALHRQQYIASDPVNTYTTAHNEAKFLASAELKPILELQDSYQNPVIEETKWRGTILLGAGFTRFDYVTDPTNKVFPERTQSITFQNPVSDFTNSSISNNSIIKDSRYLDETFIKYEKGNIVETKSRDGILTSYIWGYTNTLPVVKAIGVSYSILKSAYDAVGGDLSLLRNQSTLAGALMNTYSYSPGVGITIETDPRGKNINYQYDVLGRMVFIKDQDGNIIKSYDYKYQQ